MKRKDANFPIAALVTFEGSPRAPKRQARLAPLRFASLVATALVAGCTGGPRSSTVEIYSWWVSGAEQNALDAVLTDFENRNGNISVTNAAAENALTAQQELQTRMAEGNPPDTFQVNAGAELRQYVQGATPSLEALNLLATEQNWNETMQPAVLQAVTFGAHIYAVPVDIARINALFYNKHLFEANGLTPPATLDDFVRVAGVLSEHHIKPLEIGAQVPWTLEVLFKGCLVAAGAGPAYYTEFSSGQNPYFAHSDPAPPSSSSAPVDPIFNAAVACFGTLLSWANLDDMRSLTWDRAVQNVRQGSAAMTIMGDWALGEFLNEQADAGVDFGEVPAPGSAGTFIFTTDTFVLPKGAANRAGAIALLTEWGSAAGQSAFYPAKGTIAARKDVDPSGYDSIARATMADFNADALVPDWALAMPPAFTTNFDLALDRFAYDGNAENVVLAAKNNYDLVAAGHWP
jgi:glucose/mannose transport system substrate-binding protein